MDAKAFITRVKTSLISWLSEDFVYKQIDNLIRSPEGQTVESVCRQVLPGKYQYHMSERKAMEEAYIRCQRRGVQVAGWKLRFLIYYFYGKNSGEW